MMKPCAREYVLELLNGSVSAEYEVNLYKMKVFEKKNEFPVVHVEKKVTESRAHNLSAGHLWMCCVKKQEKQKA
ncbi:MAG: hypothetical protein J7M18_04815 [Candidatus Eremiobacteraeota bacterium]|nr:hypothetical protein [Candidatus Eremiobacteraeota bacterium]